MYLYQAIRFKNTCSEAEIFETLGDSGKADITQV